MVRVVLVNVVFVNLSSTLFGLLYSVLGPSIQARLTLIVGANTASTVLRFGRSVLRLHHQTVANKLARLLLLVASSSGNSSDIDHWLAQLISAHDGMRCSGPA